MKDINIQIFNMPQNETPEEKDKKLVENISLLIFGIILAVSVERFFSPGGLSNSKWGYILCAGLFFILIGISLIGFLIAYWKWIPFFLKINWSRVIRYLPQALFLLPIIIGLIVLYYINLGNYIPLILIIVVLPVIYLYITSFNLLTLIILVILFFSVLTTYILFFFKNSRFEEEIPPLARYISCRERSIKIFFAIMFIFFISLFPLFIGHTIKACGCVEHNSNEKYTATLTNIENIQKSLLINSSDSFQKDSLESKNLTVETIVSPKSGTFDFEIIHILFFPFWFFFVILGFFLYPD